MPVQSIIRNPKILIIVGFVAIAALILVVHHFQLRSALASYIAELKVKGESMDLAQVLPAPATAEQNAVPFITQSLTNFGRWSMIDSNPPVAMHVTGSGLAVVGWKQRDIRAPGGTNSWEDLAHELTADKSRLDAFEALTNHPVLDFHLDYQQGPSMRLPHLWPMRRASDLLNASALYNLHSENVTNAVHNIRLILAFVKGQTEEPLANSQLVRIAIGNIAAAGTWEALQHPNISTEDLQLLQRDWESVEFIKLVKRAYSLERLLVVTSMERSRENPDPEWEWVMSRNKIDKFWHKNEWRYFWSYADEKRALETYEVLIDATRMAEKTHSYESAKWFVTTNFVRIGIETPQLHQNLGRMDIDEFAMRWIFSEDARDSFQLLRRGLAAETMRNVVITAIALKRYELRHQHSPASLQGLVPDYLEKVPIDWMDGKQLRYRLKTDGTWLLYSVGENGKDDGGNPAPEGPIQDKDGIAFYWENPDALDRVWPRAVESDTSKRGRN